MKKRIVQILIMVVVLAVLLIPSINPFLNDAQEAAVKAQIQDSFGGLLSGTGMLTPGRLICAVAAILLTCLLCMLICWILEGIAQKKRNSRSMTGLFSSLVKFLGFIAGGAWVLSILGVNLTGIFASLGIASLIVGFGA